MFFALLRRLQVLCASTVRSAVPDRPGAGSSFSGRDQSYLYISMLGAGGGPGKSPRVTTFSKIKRLSPRLGQSRAKVRVCARATGEGRRAGGRTQEAGGGVHTDPTLRPRTFSAAQRLLLAGVAGSQPIWLGSRFSWAGTPRLRSEEHPRRSHKH